MHHTILAIESSCDDTAAAICVEGEILSNVVSSQLIHSAWGGVVPELASREHLRLIIPVVEEALRQANCSVSQINAVAFTRGPGLIGSLWVGLGFAKALSLAWDVPLLEVDHMQAHVLAHFIDESPAFPFLCLTVSGGHTQIVRVDDYFSFTVLGQTRDDAAGEAFDKTAKILGLPYPGGPLLDQYARSGNPDRFAFTSSQVPGLDFSFSGLKTAVLYLVKKQSVEQPDFVQHYLPDLCASIQSTIVRMLCEKMRKAIRQTGITRIALSGGVSANSSLRKSFYDLASETGGKAYVPSPAYCTDNAAMIAIAGYYKFLRSEFADQYIQPYAR
jgi:N6-L-threonylcarbamoyladenine synthase